MSNNGIGGHTPPDKTFRGLDMMEIRKLEVDRVDFNENVRLGEEEEEIIECCKESWGCENCQVLTPWEYVDYANEALQIPERLRAYFDYHLLLKDQRINGEADIVEVDGNQYIILLEW